jgi:hypothetical protein
VRGMGMPRRGIYCQPKKVQVCQAFNCTQNLSALDVYDLVLEEQSRGIQIQGYILGLGLNVPSSSLGGFRHQRRKLGLEAMGKRAAASATVCLRRSA